MLAFRGCGLSAYCPGDDRGVLRDGGGVGHRDRASPTIRDARALPVSGVLDYQGGRNGARSRLFPQTGNSLFFQSTNSTKCVV